MQKGFFAHACCCGNRLYNKHIVTIDSQCLLISLSPFIRETAHTVFTDGMLIVADETFDCEIENFMSELREQLTRQPQTTIVQAIQENSIYHRHHTSINTPCTLYSLQPIAWQSMQPQAIETLSIKKIV